MSEQRIIYIALLRGINVGGHIIKMDRLRKLFEESRFENVRSFIQSGNIFFESSETNKLILRNKIEKHLRTTLGYVVIVILRTKEELEQLLKREPFKGIEVTPDVRFAVTFLTEPTTQSFPLPYLTPDGGYELIGMTTLELFIVWHLKDGRPGAAYGLLGETLKVQSTTRFWHTTARILEAVEKSQ